MLVTVGRLVARKGLDALLSVLSQLGDARFKLVVVGEGPARAELEAQARRIAQRSEAPLHEMGEAARKLFDELRAGYRELRRQL